MIKLNISRIRLSLIGVAQDGKGRHIVLGSELYVLQTSKATPLWLCVQLDVGPSILSIVSQEPAPERYKTFSRMSHQ